MIINRIGTEAVVNLRNQSVIRKYTIYCEYGEIPKSAINC